MKKENAEMVYLVRDLAFFSSKRRNLESAITTLYLSTIFYLFWSR